ncbi:MAG: hypothetical protein WD847_10605 [Pirellulales bacterium]
MDAAHALWKDPVLKPTAIFWLYDDDASEWRFVIATEDARRRGPQAAYLRVRNLLKRAGLLDRLPLRRVVVVDPAHPLLTSVAAILSTPGNSLAGMSFYDCVVNNVPIAGMHLYHMNADIKASGSEAKKRASHSAVR